MYEPDSSSSSVVSSTSRSPQSQSQQQQQQHQHQAQWASKPLYGDGGGSPTITTNGAAVDGQTQLYMTQTHDHYGNGNGNGMETVLMDQESWYPSHGEGMEAIKKDAVKVPAPTAASAGTTNGAQPQVYAQELPSTTTANGSNSSVPSSTSAQDQPEQSSNLSSTQNSPTKTKPPKLCQVCGDKAKSFHFGGLSCDSCKAFFRRSVHNDAHKAFTCVYNRDCEITISSRKSCQACRFKKCLAIGMETNWVMTEEERNLLQKQRNEKKEAGKTPAVADGAPSTSATTPAAAAGEPEPDTEPEFEPNVAEMLKFMTVEERDEIEAIVNKYQHSYREIPFRVSNSSGQRKTVEIIQMFTTILRRFAYFTKLIPEFATLAHGDQSTLLRAGVLEMCLLRSALAFDMKNNRWPKTENMEFLKDCPQLRVEDMEKLVSKDLYHMHMNFINGIQELKVDEPTVMILLLIVLFYPERGPLEQQEMIAHAQERYLLLLKKYVQWRFGPRAGLVFPKLLTRLADLRQLNDFHTEYNLKMTKTEVEEIQEQLGNINLNPYPQWVLVDQQQKQAAAAAAMHSAHAYADPSALGDAHAAHAYQQTPSPDFQARAQEIAMHMSSPEPHMQIPMNYGAPPPQMPYAANAGAPRQFPPSAAAAGVGGMPQMPNMRQLFMQFVSQRIPTLINNPFATFPMDTEMSGAAAFFEQMSAAGGAGGLSGASLQQIQSLMAGAGGGGLDAAMSMGMSMGDIAGGVQQMQAPTPAPPTAHMQASAGSAPISQICNILESSDPDTLRQLKDGLSPAMVAKLSTIFGGGGGGGGGGAAAAAELFGSGSFDLSKIPPELIQSFLGCGGTSPTMPTDLGSYQQQFATGAGYTSSGYGHGHGHNTAYEQQQLDLSAPVNWSGGGIQEPLQLHQQQQPVLGTGPDISGVGPADYTSAAFLTHRHAQIGHFDHTPNAEAGAQGRGHGYGNGHAHGAPGGTGNW